MLEGKVDTFVDINSGIQVKTGTGNACHYLQVKHFDEDGKIIKDALAKELGEQDIRSKQLLEVGDVIFCSKGSRYFAAIITDEMLPAMASSMFFVLRIKRQYLDMIQPKFLAWFLNNPDTMKKIQAQSKGTAISAIPKHALSELEITIPDLDIQHAVTRLYDLRHNETALLKELQGLIDEETHAILSQLLR
jgi:restriction endonuclease S subunit